MRSSQCLRNMSVLATPYRACNIATANLDPSKWKIRRLFPAIQAVNLQRGKWCHYFPHYFPFFGPPLFPPLSTFFIKGMLKSKNLVGRPLSRPCWLFWGPLAAIFHFWCSHIEEIIKSKNLFCESWLEGQLTQGFTSFKTLLAILEPPGGHFRFCRQ